MNEFAAMELLTNPQFTDPLFYWNFFILQLQTNQIFVGLLVLSLLGTIGYTLRSIPGKIWDFLVGQFTVQLKIMNEDDFYDSLKLYLSQTNYVKYRCRRLTLDTNYETIALNNASDSDQSPRTPSLFGRLSGAITRRNKPAPKINKKPSYTLTPMDGSHWFFYRRNIIFYTRTIDEDRGDFRKETITLRYIGRSRQLIYDLIEDMERMVEKDNDTFGVSIGNSNYWNWIGRKMKRPMDTIYIPKEQKEFLMNDIKWFFDNSEWYTQRGIPYHRGYLFSGPPGTGKTSVIKALCSELDMRLAICNITGISNDKELLDLMAEPMSNSIIVIEDIDACMASEKRNVKSTGKKKRGKVKEEGVTLSGLLNALDGVTTPENQIFIMTTNHPEKLDPALMRKGRVDVHLEFKNMEADLVKEMFLAYFPEQKRYAKKVAEALTADGPVSPATIQGMFFEYAKDPKDFVKELLKKAA